MTTERPRFHFSPNLLDPADPLFHLELYHPAEGTWFAYEMTFRETLFFCQRLTQEVTEIALRNPALRARVIVRDVDLELAARPTDESPAADSYKSKRGFLARLLARGS